MPGLGGVIAPSAAPAEGLKPGGGRAGDPLTLSGPFMGRCIPRRPDGVRLRFRLQMSYATRVFPAVGR